MSTVRLDHYRIISDDVVDLAYVDVLQTVARQLRTDVETHPEAAGKTKVAGHYELRYMATYQSDLDTQR